MSRLKNKIKYVFLCLSIFLRCTGASPTSEKIELPLTFNVLTYNINGLPDDITNLETETNLRIISPLLNAYDLVFLQEDFAYHSVVIAKSKHPYKITPTSRNGLYFGNGLTVLSRFPLDEIEYHEWTTCSDKEAFDCNARKGFTVAKAIFTDDVQLDIYNLHMDAGGAQEDQTARQDQIHQLLNVISTRSIGRSIILAGDLNLDITSRPTDLSLYSTLLDSANLLDACSVNNCEQEMIDRILFRPIDNIKLSANAWQIASEFIDQSDQPLSDHLAITVEFRLDLTN